MTNDDSVLIRVGSQVAEALGVGPDEPRRNAQRTALLACAGSWNRPSRGFKVAVASVLAVAIVAVLGGVYFFRDRPLSFTVGGESQSAEEGRWIDNIGESPLPVRFADGSVVELQDDARARVVTARVHEVVLDLSTGAIVVRIRPDGGTRWAIAVGPYRLTVLGTEFTVIWDPLTVNLTVSVGRGVVLVEGRNLNPSGIELAAGDRLQINGRTDRFVMGRAAEEMIDERNVSADSMPEVATECIGSAGEAPLDSPAARVGRPTRPAVEESKVDAGSITGHSETVTAPWVSHFEGGDYNAAVDAALRHGLDELLNELDQEQLWLLADSARYSRRAELASRILSTIRQRFDNSARTRTATFLLGRVSQELGGDPMSAKRWYEAYLLEAPNGPLVEEALGRLIDASAKAGNISAAESAARKYLKRYPDGLFATLAMSTLEQ